MVSNPRFPHVCTIKKAQVDSSGTPVTDSDGNEVYETILETQCGLRTMSQSDINSGMLETDIKLALPIDGIVNIKNNTIGVSYPISLPIVFSSAMIALKDSISFDNSITGETLSGEISSFRVTNFGCNIYFHKNG